jgi:hypothetical protein
MGEQPGTGGPRVWSADEVKRLYLKRADSADAPASVLPEIGGETSPGGFIQRTGYAGRIVITIFGAFAVLVSATMVVGLLRTIDDGIRRQEWVILTGVVLVFLPALYLILRTALPPLRRMFLAQWLNPGSELTIERWPLHLGEETRVIYRSRPRPEWGTARIESMLQCVESVEVQVAYSDKGMGRTRWETREHIVREMALPPMTPLVELSTAVKAEWKIRIPDTGLPSFKAGRNAILWRLVVTSHGQEEGLEDTTSFELLVRPEVVI